MAKNNLLCKPLLLMASLCPRNKCRRNSLYMQLLKLTRNSNSIPSNLCILWLDKPSPWLML